MPQGRPSLGTEKLWGGVLLTPFWGSDSVIKSVQVSVQISADRCGKSLSAQGNLPHLVFPARNRDDLAILVPQHHGLPWWVGLFSPRSPVIWRRQIAVSFTWPAPPAGPQLASGEGSWDLAPGDPIAEHFFSRSISGPGTHHFPCAHHDGRTPS